MKKFYSDGYKKILDGAYIPVATRTLEYNHTEWYELVEDRALKSIKEDKPYWLRCK